tara:strand:+ start:4689 stop:5399 length:711 start_codon:yes stop_codon:yes gene_type:complete
MKIINTQDNFYIKENGYKKPKEMFKFIAKKALKKNTLNKKICDFGCATGDFLFYLNKIKPENEYTGIDIKQNVLNKAKKYLPEVNFKRGSVLNKKIKKENSFDLSFLIGVHPAFDSFEECFSNLIYWTKPKGEIFICDLFNPDPVDVLVKYRLSKNYKINSFEAGWNIFSHVSIKNFLKKNKKVKSCSFEEFYMPFHLKRQKNPIRSWTMSMNKKKVMVNGLSIIQRQSILRIKLK